MPRFCIINGDDFGASAGVNRGIVEAHCDGVLTSASLMVNRPGAAEAARLSRDLPQMSVGLHCALTAEDSSALVDFDSPSDCRAEIAAQWVRFVDLVGSAPTHLDCHHNVHRDPRLTPVLLEWAHRHRVPLREHSPVRYFSSFYGQWDGETHLEQIGVDMLCRMLRAEIGEGVTELSCHPGYVDADFVSDYSIEREAELRTLCDPVVRAVIEEQQIELISYRDLHRVSAARDEAVEAT